MDEAVELAELRRRAYGPAGGIDAAGIARLTLLEDRLRGGVTAPAETARAADEETDPEALIGLVPTAPATPAPAPTATPATALRPRRAPRTRWAWVAGALVVGVVAGAGITQALAATASPRPEEILTVVADRPGREAFPTEAVSYAMYHALDVRSWTDPSGMHCLAIAVTGEGTEGLYPLISCAAMPFSVYVDATVTDGSGDPSFPFQPQYLDGAEAGEQFRFELAGDEVLVWRADPPAPQS